MLVVSNKFTWKWCWVLNIFPWQWCSVTPHGSMRRKYEAQRLVGWRYRYFGWLRHLRRSAVVSSPFRPQFRWHEQSVALYLTWLDLTRCIVVDVNRAKTVISLSRDLKIMKATVWLVLRCGVGGNLGLRCSGGNLGLRCSRVYACVVWLPGLLSKRAY